MRDGKTYGYVNEYMQLIDRLTDVSKQPVEFGRNTK